MERLKAHEIAAHLDPKIDPAHVRGTQDWVPDTHSHLTISELVHQVPGQEAVVQPFRVTNRETGEIHTRLPDEKTTVRRSVTPPSGDYNDGPVYEEITLSHILDPAHVLGTYAAVMAIQREKNKPTED